MTVPTPSARRALPAAALALAALGGLTACADQSADAAGSGASSGTSSSSAAAGEASAASGTWTETGDYQTPGGTESVTVTLTAKDGVVSAVKVTGSGNDANSRRYQSAFISGVQGEVVGKQLSTLQVGAVSGSSLTGNGFNAAVAKIREDAA